MKPAAAKTSPARSQRAHLEQHIATVLRRLGLYSVVHALYGRFFKKLRGQSLQTHAPAFCPTELAQLAPQARKIYADLKDEIKRRQQGGR